MYMKLVVVYRPKSEHARKLEEFVEDLKTRHALSEEQIELQDIDTRQGSATAEVYGIMAYPGIIVTDNNGACIKVWSGELPLQNEIMSYLFTG